MRAVSVWARPAQRLVRCVVLTGVLSAMPLAALATERPTVVGPLVLDTRFQAGWIYATHWTSMMLRRRADGTPCADALVQECELADWRGFVGSLGGEDRLGPLDKVNRYVNRVAYREDQMNWGQRDYWAAPREFFGRGGDCEDYAIAKYLSLKSLGVPVAELRVLILWDSRRAIAHAVLAVGPSGRELVLDNIHSVIYPLSALPHYRVHYSLNEDTVLRHLARN